MGTTGKLVKLDKMMRDAYSPRTFGLDYTITLIEPTLGTINLLLPSLYNSFLTFIELWEALGASSLILS